MNYEQWAIDQLREITRCRVEATLRCIPLRNDPICRGCFESDRVKKGGISDVEKD